MAMHRFVQFWTVALFSSTAASQHYCLGVPSTDPFVLLSSKTCCQSRFRFGEEEICISGGGLRTDIDSSNFFKLESCDAERSGWTCCARMPRMEVSEMCPRRAAPTVPIPSAEEFCSAACTSAGYCCNDYRTGSNQMISCSQACMMRTSGTPLTSMASSRGGLCARTGSSGCSLSVQGQSYGFCSRCKDLTDNSKCEGGVASSDACDYGASLVPTAPSAEEFCSAACTSAGYCCNDYRTGSNQMISCSQACMMRASGTPLTIMASSRGGLCARTGSSGCSLSVQGQSYGFCSRCKDLTDNSKCEWGVASSDACDHGASLVPIVPSAEEFCSAACTSAGYCCNDYKTGSNQMISCSQACMMRKSGSSWRSMASSQEGLCARTGSSGCSLSVQGQSYSFCSTCKDLTDNSKCKHGVASSEACDYGASLVDFHIR